ncbi:MAG: hypothetical protein KF901_03625 [Myxococcales bacterium]|nr:hypothetical protein [Myxococcales bacterium]
MSLFLALALSTPTAYAQDGVVPDPETTDAASDAGSDTVSTVSHAAGSDTVSTVSHAAGSDTVSTVSHAVSEAGSDTVSTGSDAVLGVGSDVDTARHSSPVRLTLPSTDVDRLAYSLEYAALAFDPVSFLAAQRALVVAVFEAYCAFDHLLERNPSTVDLVLGVGCLVGAATLAVIAYRGFARPRGPRDARQNYDDFVAARAAGLTPTAFEASERALEAAAARDRRRRIFGGVFGALNLVATAVLIGFTARSRIDTHLGAAIATGTTAVGGLGLAAIFVRSPSERAWRRYATP